MQAPFIITEYDYFNDLYLALKHTTNNSNTNT